MPRQRLDPPSVSEMHSTDVEVDIYDKEVFLQKVPVNLDGTWSARVPSLSLGAHSLTARVAGITSTARTFTVEEAIPPLVLDESPANLQARLYILTSSTQAAVPKFPNGSTITRIPTGGRPPYTYSTSNSAIVNVTSSGLATPRANGSATITVRDQAGQSKQYWVTVSNVLTAYLLGQLSWQAANTYQKPGGHQPSRAEFAEIRAQYDQTNWPVSAGFAYDLPYWTGEKSEDKPIGPFYWAIRPSDGNQTSMFGQSYIYNSFSIYPSTS